jgi:hypothetical protein
VGVVLFGVNAVEREIVGKTVLGTVEGNAELGVALGVALGVTLGLLVTCRISQATTVITLTLSYNINM